jgi:predicted MFS family arabinose efflux permease
MTPFTWLAVISGGLIIAFCLGIRYTFGLFLPPMTIDLGIGREAFAFALAVQQVFWGVFQPPCGMIADKYGAGRVLLVGAAAYALGLVIMAHASDPLTLNLGVGVLVGFAVAATSFAVVLGAVGRLAPPERRGLALGVASAGGSFGQFVMIPVGHALLAGFGWSTALLLMAALSALMVPLALPLKGRPVRSEGRQSLKSALAEAAGHSGYWYLTAGFFVCGFHVAFIAFHLPAYLTDIGLSADTGAIALTLIGLFNIVGTYGFGALGDRWSKKYLLAVLYAVRGLIIALFVFLPKSELSVYLFASAMGVLWLGTVPLTSGLIAQIFGVRYLGTLFGIAFFSHQLGSFLGVWLAGRLFDITGSYDTVWLIAIALGVLAGVINMPIADRPLRRDAMPIAGSSGY